MQVVQVHLMHVLGSDSHLCLVYVALKSGSLLHVRSAKLFHMVSISMCAALQHDVPPL